MATHVWIAAAASPWSATSTDRAVQMSTTRTVALSDTEHHNQLWPVLEDFARRFVADARLVVAPAELTARQRQCPAYELLGVDVMLTADLSHAFALECNSGPRLRDSEAAMQLAMMRIVLGGCAAEEKAEEGGEKGEVREGDEWIELSSA